MAAIYYTDDAGNEVRFEIPAGAAGISIGRGANNDLRIRKPSISRKHARVAMDGGGVWTFTDLGSSNGSWAEGERMVPQQARDLSGGEKLKCGEVHLRFDAGPPPAVATEAAPDEIAPMASPPPAPPPPAMEPLPPSPPPPSADPFEKPPPPVPGPLDSLPPPATLDDDPLAGLDIPAPPVSDAAGSPMDDSLIDLFGGADGPAASGPADTAMAEPVGANTPFPDPPAAEALPVDPFAPEPELPPPPAALPGVDFKEPTDLYGQPYDMDEPAPPFEFGDPPSLAPAEFDLDLDDSPEVDADFPPPPDLDDSLNIPPEAIDAAIEEAAQGVDELDDAQEDPSQVLQAIGDAEVDLFGDGDADDGPSQSTDSDDGDVLAPLPELPDDPAVRARLLEDLVRTYRKDLEAKSRRVVSLQKAARRDVDTKKRLGDAKKEGDAKAEQAIHDLESVTTERATLREDVDRLNGLLAEGEAGVSVVESQLQETRSELDAVKVERDDLSRQNAVMSSELDTRPTDEQVDGLQAGIDDLKGQLDVVSTERDMTLERASRGEEFERQAKQLTAENDDLTESLKAAPRPERYKEMELELRALRRDAGSGAGKANILEKQLKDAQDAQDKFKAKARKSFDELAKTLKALEADKNAAQGELAQLKAVYAEASESGDDAAQKLADLRQQVDTLTGDHAELAQSLGDTTARADAAEERNKTLEGDLQTFQVESEGALPPSEAEALKGELDELKTEHDAVRSELDETKSALGEAEKRIDELQGMAEAAEEGLGTEVAKLKEEGGALEGRAAAAEGLANDLQGKVEASEAAAAEAKEALAEMEAEVTVLRQAGDAAMGDVEAEREDARKLKTNLEDATAKIEEMESTVEALRLAANGAPGADAGGDPEATGSTRSVDGAMSDEVQDLIDRINDVVSNWKNNFMHISNFLLDVRNGLDLLKQEGADVTGVLEEMEASGSASEMQELMQRCEDDSRALKKDLKGFRS